MTRERSLTLLSEIIDLIKTEKPAEAVHSVFLECLSNFSFLLTLTSNDARERKMLANSLSIWSKISEVTQLVLVYLDTHQDESASEEIVYRIRLGRGVLLFAGNLVVGLKSLLSLPEQDRLDFYASNDLRCRDLSCDVLIQSLYSNHTRKMIPLIIRYIKTLDKFDDSADHVVTDLYMNSLIACFQYLTNVTNIAPELKEGEIVFDWEIIMDLFYNLTRYWSVSKLQEHLTAELAIPLFMYIRNLLNHEKLLTRIFAESRVHFVNFIGCFLSETSAMIATKQQGKDIGDSGRYHDAEIVYLGIYTVMISHESMGSFLIKCSQNSQNDQHSAAVQELLRVAQLLLSSKESGWTTLQLTNITASILDYYRYVADEAILLLEKPALMLEETQQLTLIHRRVVSTLDCLSSIVHHDHVREMLNYYKFLPELLRLFQVVEANTHKKKLKDETRPLHAKEFPQAKIIIIELITALVYENFENQELVRNQHGLELVLNNCNLDSNEPFIKERAILCIKYLLLDNQANQDFVARLEARGSAIDPANAEALSQAGYEVDITNGKVQLKKSAKLMEVEEQARVGGQ